MSEPRSASAKDNTTDVPEGMYECRQVLTHKTYPIGLVYCCVDCKGLESPEEWNARVEEMKEDIEFEPLLEFIDRLKDPVG